MQQAHVKPQHAICRDMYGFMPLKNICQCVSVQIYNSISAAGHNLLKIDLE